MSVTEIVLKPCPYCGNENPVLKKVPMVSRYYVECESYCCNRIIVRYFDRPEDAVESWNKGDK